MLYINTKGAPKWAFVIIIAVILFLGYLLSGCSGCSVKEATICDKLLNQRNNIVLNNSEDVGSLKATDSMLIICGCTGNHTNPGP